MMPAPSVLRITVSRRQKQAQRDPGEEQFAERSGRIDEGEDGGLMDSWNGMHSVGEGGSG